MNLCEQNILGVGPIHYQYHCRQQCTPVKRSRDVSLRWFTDDYQKTSWVDDVIKKLEWPMKEESKIVKIHNFLQISGQTDHTDFKHQPTANLHTKSQKKKKVARPIKTHEMCPLTEHNTNYYQHTTTEIFPRTVLKWDSLPLRSHRCAPTHWTFQFTLYYIP